MNSNCRNRKKLIWKLILSKISSEPAFFFAPNRLWIPAPEYKPRTGDCSRGRRLGDGKQGCMPRRSCMPMRVYINLCLVIFCRVDTYLPNKQHCSSNPISHCTSRHISKIGPPHSMSPAYSQGSLLSTLVISNWRTITKHARTHMCMFIHVNYKKRLVDFSAILKKIITIITGFTGYINGIPEVPISSW